MLDNFDCFFAGTLVTIIICILVQALLLYLGV